MIENFVIAKLFISYLINYYGKRTKSAFSDDSQENAVRYCLPDIGRLRKELPLQRELYQKGTPVQMEKAFAGGVCFNQQIQQQIILEDNLAVMDVFADYWDLIPDMRKLNGAPRVFGYERTLFDTPLFGKTMSGAGEKYPVYAGISSPQSGIFD